MDNKRRRQRIIERQRIIDSDALRAKEARERGKRSVASLFQAEKVADNGPIPPCVIIFTIFAAIIIGYMMAYISVGVFRAAQLALPLRHAEPIAPTTAAIAGFHRYTLLSNRQVSSDSSLLRFALQSEQTRMQVTLPSCVKIRQTVLALDGSSSAVMEKSYSPVSFPDDAGFFELLVKGYPPRQADHPLTHGAPGGLGAWLVAMRVGDSTEVRVKPERKFHGAPYTANRWRELGLVAGGTGIAPFMQIIRTVLSNPNGRTLLSLISANRREKDILLRRELDAYAAAHPTQLRLHYVLSQPPSPPTHGAGAGAAASDKGWGGGMGHISAEDVVPAHLPVPGTGVMVMVCGRDEFLVTVSGATTRGVPLPGKTKGPKLQGPLTGILREAGFTEEMVYKF